MMLVPLLACTMGHPMGDKEELEFFKEDVSHLLEKLFVEDGGREGRQMELEMDNVIQTDEPISTVEEIVAVAEVGSGKEEVVMKEMPDFKEKQEIDPQEISRFNNYMDAIYRRMNAALRAKLMDPMVLNLSPDTKKKRVTRSVVDTESEIDEEEDDMEKEMEEDEEEAVSVNRMGKAKKGKKGGNKKKDHKKKGGKNSGKGKNKSKSAEKKKKQDDAPQRKERSGHRGQQGKKHNSKPANDKRKPKPVTKQSVRGEKARNNKEVREAKTMGSLAGIATLRRSGDVVIEDVETHKIVSSTFQVGPLALEVSKTYGRGQARTVRTAKAVTEEMFGTMQIKVKPDGSAHVKKVVFQNPESVEIKGSITDKRQRSDTYLRNSVKRMRPVAAQKILKTARYVLKAPSSIRRN